MARRTSRRERLPAELECNDYGHQFEGWAWFESVESAERGILGWQPVKGGALDVCPECGSDRIKTIRELT
jgi:hypothetical protein